MDKTTTDTLTLLRATRRNIRGLCRPFGPEQLNAIPSGFNNNLIWNAGHVVATMELLTYGLVGQRTPSGRDFIDRYRKGTRPEGPVDREEIDSITDRLKTGVDDFEAALKSMDLSTFKSYQTSFGVELTGMAEAIAFNNMHEAMHLGTMLALRKLV